MARESLAEVRQRYEQAKVLGPSLLQAEAPSLQGQDASGRTWRIDVATGGWLLWDGGRWVPADPGVPGSAPVAPMPGQAVPMPPAAPAFASPPQAQGPMAPAYPAASPFPAPPSPGYPSAAAPWAGGLRPAAKKPLAGPGCAQIAGWTFSAFVAFVWFVYTSLVRSSEGWDLLTPLIIAGISPAIFFTRRFTDPILATFVKARNVVPTALRLGAAAAVPFVVGLMLAVISSSGYGAIRLTVLTGAVVSWLLLRNPEVTS